MDLQLCKATAVCIAVLLTTAVGVPEAHGQAVWGDPGTSKITAKADASRFTDNDPDFPCDGSGCLPTRRYSSAEWNLGADCNPPGGKLVVDPCTYLIGPPLPGGGSDPLPLFDPGADCFANATDAMTLGFGGHYAGGLASASADYPWPSSRTPPCHPLVDNLSIQADAYGRGVFDGIGSPLLSARWKCHAITSISAECFALDYCVYGTAQVNNQIVVTVDGVPNGEPVLIHAAWYLLLNTLYDPEDAGPPPDDPAEITINQFDVRIVGGMIYDLLPPGGLAFNDVNTVAYYPPTGGSSVIAAEGGDTIIINLKATVAAGVKDPPRLVGPLFDRSWGLVNGVMLLSLNQPVQLPPPYLQPGPPAEFSLDIGSDTEMSDPHQDLDEVFDPGDMYPWNGPPLPPGGDDGFRDDALIFGVDFWPQAPDGPPSTTGALTCQSTGTPVDEALIGSRFDLDGSDTIGADLLTLIPPSRPLRNPILLAQHPIDCVYRPNYLIVSLDDDEAGHYIGTPTTCSVPVNSQSLLSTTPSRTYGQSLERDEVLAIAGLNLVSPPSMHVIDAVGIRDEESLHASLYPNPSIGEQDDDDVDALDVDDALCDWWYISGDQEATGVDGGGFNIDAGSIYRVNPLGGMPTKVIDDVTHLGLDEATDIDAFEFVWLPHPSVAGNALAMLFSVDADDPLTSLIDESGGLDPRQIYASFFDGTHFPYLGYENATSTFVATPLDDNVDGIAASPLPFAASPCGVQVPYFASGFDAHLACAPVAGTDGWEVWPNPLGNGGEVYTDTISPLVPCGPQPAFSGTQSARIIAGDDVLKQLSITPPGMWVATAHVYVPSSATGAGYFNLLNDYDPSQSDMLPADYWSVQLKFDADNAQVIEELSGDTAPLPFDQWVQVRAEIDLDNDQLDLYYAGVLMHSGVWTRGLPQASLDLAVVDLYGNTISEMFFDDVIVWSTDDCNGNHVADACDIAAGVSEDCNMNGVLDECEAPFPDFDGDGDVDWDDRTVFYGCFTGPCLGATCNLPLYTGPCCRLADGDSDGDVDMADSLWFQGLYTGP
jgi:hypothetical protein